jgi:hypothetical protein
MLPRSPGAMLALWRVVGFVALWAFNHLRFKEPR